MIMIAGVIAIINPLLFSGFIGSNGEQITEQEGQKEQKASDAADMGADVYTDAGANPVSDDSSNSDLTKVQKEQKIYWNLDDNYHQAVVDAANQRVGYRETSDFDKGMRESITWHTKDKDYDVVDFPNQWRIDIDWEGGNYRGPYRFPGLDGFPTMPSVEGKESSSLGHIAFST